MPWDQRACARVRVWRLTEGREPGSEQPKDGVGEEGAVEGGQLHVVEEEDHHLQREAGGAHAQQRVQLRERRPEQGVVLP